MRFVLALSCIAFLVCARPAPARGGDALLEPSPLIAGVIDAAARAFAVEPELLYAIAQVESGFNPRAVAPGGYMGLFQLSPVYFKPPPGESLLDPLTNARIAAAFVRRLLNSEHSVEGALRRYSATPATAQKQFALYRARKALELREPPTVPAPLLTSAPEPPLMIAPPRSAPLPLETPPQRPAHT